MSRINRFREALKENFNLAGLATAVLSAAYLVHPLPLLIGLVAEVAYLLFVPDSKWYENRLSKRHDAEVLRRREELKKQILPILRPEVRERFARLEEIRRQLDERPVEDPTWFRQVLRKLDFLIEKYLQFASKEMEFRRYLASLRADLTLDNRQESRGEWQRNARQVAERHRKRGGRDGVRGEYQVEPDFDIPLDPNDRWVARTVEEIQAHYDREMEGVKQQLEQDHDVSTKNVLEKRLEVLQRRHEFVRKINTILTNLNHQLRLLEDTFGLINDEIRARSPEQVLSDIDEVVISTNTMTQVLEEMMPYEQMIARLS
jgi:hypothetical protein